MSGEEKELGGDWDRSMKHYVDGYKELGERYHAKGILQEIIMQNTIDQAVGKIPANVVIDVVVDDPKGDLSIRDFGTTGMHDCDKCEWGELPDGGDCVDCPWGSFHFMAAAQKIGGLGDRGMGKSLLLQAGERIFVKTKVATKDGTHRAMASEFYRSTRTGRWLYRLRKDLAPDENEKPGTKIIVENVNAEILEDLKQFEELRDTYLQPHWWPSFAQGVVLKYRVRGQKRFTVKRPLKFPDSAESTHKTKFNKKKIPLKIKVDGKYRKIGDMMDLNIVLAEEPVDKSIRGIALVKRGTQVIECFKDWSRKVPPAIQDRIYGWVILDEQLSEELKIFERQSHIGYHKYNPEVEAVIKKIKAFADKLLKPHINELKKKSKHSDQDKKKLRAAQNVINEALLDIPQFNPWDEEIIDPIIPPPLPNEKTIAYINMKSDKKHYDSGDTCTVTVSIQNPVADYQRHLSLKIETMDSHHQVLETKDIEAHEIGVVPPQQNGENGTLVAPLWNFVIDNNFNQGKNWVRVSLYDTVTDEISGVRAPVRIDRKKMPLWVDQEPPPPNPREPRPKSSPSDMKLFFGENELEDRTWLDVVLDYEDQSADVDYKNGPRLKETWGVNDPLSRTHIFSGVAEGLVEIMFAIRLSEDDSYSDGNIDARAVTRLLFEIMENQKLFLASCGKRSRNR